MICADLIQVFKTLNNIDRVDKFFFTFALNDRIGQSLNLYKSRFNLDIKRDIAHSVSKHVCLSEPTTKI